MPTIKLQSSDNDVFIADINVAKCSGTIRNMLEDCGMENGDDTVIPLPNVNSKILQLVLEWATHHKDDADTVMDTENLHNYIRINEWDAEFLQVDQITLFDLIVAANYLDIKLLLDMTAQTIADMIRGLTPEEMRAYFNIENDFTPEEEDRIRKENTWCEENADED